MTTLFELWDMETASLVGSYETEDAALEIVRSSLRSFGPASVLPLALTREEEEGEEGETRVIARGTDLLAMALVKEPTPAVG